MSTITKENPNGMNEIVIDVTTRQEPHDPQRGFGREVLRNVFYHIEVPFYTYTTFGYYGDKYEKERQQGCENARRFFDEVIAILQAAGWTLVDDEWNKEHSGDCPRLTKGDQELCCHPKIISGCVKPDEVDAVARLFAGAKTFRHRKTENYCDVIVTTSTADEMQLYHQTHDATVNQVLHELTTTKRRDLYKNEGAVWHALMNRLSIDTKRTGEIYNLDHVEQTYAKDVIQKAKADGWLVTAKNCLGAEIIRWVNKAEQREMEKKMKQ